MTANAEEIKEKIQIAAGNYFTMARKAFFRENNVSQSLQDLAKHLEDGSFSPDLMIKPSFPALPAYASTTEQESQLPTPVGPRTH